MAETLTPCKHPDFDVHADISRVGEDDPDNKRPGFPRGYYMDLRVHCTACGEPFAGKGLPAGLSQLHPTGSIDGSEIHVPIRPLSAPPDFGDDLPGYHVNVHLPESDG